MYGEDAGPFLGESKYMKLLLFMETLTKEYIFIEGKVFVSPRLVYKSTESPTRQLKPYCNCPLYILLLQYITPLRLKGYFYHKRMTRIPTHTQTHTFQRNLYFTLNLVNEKIEAITAFTLGNN